LKKGDIVAYESKEWTIAVPPKKLQRGIWILGLEGEHTDEQQYIKIYENTKPNMTAHEKKVYVNNIKSVVKEWGHDEDRMVEFIGRYLWNLSELNRFADEDVRECMALFPANLLKKSGVVL
jgi:hypothetical protein